jgi:hypothetical protein
VTQNVDIGNRALQIMGSRTNMSTAEFTGLTSNEAIQCNLIMYKLRDELNRMAPWDCVTKYNSLTYICSLPTTPENATAGAPLWQPGIPAPPWSYEYQYPVDCLRARKIIPQYTTQSGAGTPIYPAGTATGAGQVGWTGPAIRFKVSTDNFYGVTQAAPTAPGVGYSVGDILTMPQPTYTFQQNSAPVNQPPSLTTYTMTVGAPVQLLVTNVNGAGGILGVSPINQVQGETEDNQSPIGGSYFSVQGSGTFAPSASQSANNPGIPSSGSGATFSLTWTTGQALQRVILCNEEQAILCYNAQITDPNLMDPLYQDAWQHILAARLAFQLSGDKALANILIGLTNNMITEARKADGNEGLTVNDVTPDFLRIRGDYGGPNYEFSPNMSFDWGGMFSYY